MRFLAIVVLLFGLTSNLGFAHVYLNDPKNAEHISNLFYRSGDTITAFFCPSSAPNPNPSSCVVKPVKVANAKTVYQTMQDRLSVGLNDLDARIAALGARILVLDAKLDELVNAPESPEEEQGVAEALKKLDSKKTNLIEKQLSESEIQRELDALEMSLNSSPNSDLLNQAILLRSKHAQATDNRKDAEIEVTKARTSYIEVAVRHQSDARLTAVKEERKSNTDTYLILQGSARGELKRLVQMNTFASNLVEDQSFTYMIDADQLGSDAHPYKDARRFYEFVRDSVLH